jgi:diadenosine tetraphosphatase ApaH/serine/threonine PP2A family protein phosphatase
MAAQWYRYASEHLDAETKAWMAALPRRITLTLGGRRLVAIHGGVDRINHFVFPATPATEKAEQLALSGGEGVIGGHSGLPFSEIVGGRLWHNAGVIGLPANDGTPRVWYAVLRPGPEGIEVEHRPLAYDHAAAAAAIRAAGLPVAYADTLENGLWPADDVMPEADRHARGEFLSRRHLVWCRQDSA